MKNISLIILLVFGMEESFCQKSPYALNIKNEIAYFGGGMALTATGFYLENQVDPFTAKEIDQLARPSVWKWDGAALYNYSPDASRASDQLKVLGWIMPLAFAVPTTTRNDFWTIGVMGAETVLITVGLTSIFKGSVQRVRPFVYNDVAPLDEKMDVDARKSFFSGHTSNFAAISFFMAKVITDYSTDQTTELVAWSVAAVSSGAMGYLRMRSGKHFFTDVLTGYVVGAAMGIAIPQLHKTENAKKRVSIVPYYFQSVGFRLTVAL